MNIENCAEKFENLENNDVLAAIYELTGVALEGVAGGVGEVSPY